jgi:hypothetical protein
MALIQIEDNEAVERAMNLALQVGSIKRADVKSKRKQIEYALDLFVKLVDNGVINTAMLTKLK